MKLPARIVVPIVAALAVTGSAVFFFRQEINVATERARQRQTNDRPIMQAAVITDANIDADDNSLLHLRQGDLLALHGDWKSAEEEYQQSIRDGGGVVALKKLAQAQLQRREMDGVRTTLEKLKQAGARSDDLLLLEVLVALRTGEVTQATKLLTTAPDSPQKHYGLALLAVTKSDHETVKNELQQVVTGWDPILRAYAQTLQKAYAEFALFPEAREIHLDTLLARALAQVQECELALPLLSHALGEQDDYRDAWIVQGYCELSTERTQQALASLEHAYSLDPEKPEIQFFLGRAHAALGDHRNAMTFLQYAIRNGIQPQDDVRRLLAAEAVKANDPATALEQYKTLTDSRDATVDSFTQYVSFALTVNQNQDAYDTAVKAAKKWPENAGAQELLGSAALALEKKDEAKAAFEKALKIDPTRESVRGKLKTLQ